MNAVDFVNFVLNQGKFSIDGAVNTLYYLMHSILKFIPNVCYIRQYTISTDTISYDIYNIQKTLVPK